MSTVTYNKLVRDRIPEIVANAGKIAVTETLDDERYLAALDAKLDEELAEYHESHALEELADLLETLRACALARGHSLEELERARERKAKERGAFDERILLLEVVEP